MRRNGSTTPELALPTASLAALRRYLVAELGADVGVSALRQAGHAAGDALYSVLVGGGDGASEERVESLQERTFWRRLADLFAARGWGRLQHEDLHPGIGALDTHDWMEADPEAGVARPGCHFTTGLLANLLGRAAGEEVGVIEVECRSRGDLRCRFLFGGRDALDAVYEDLRSGGTLEESLAQLT
jgi:predicted hydrocarbon binding protein